MVLAVTLVPGRSYADLPTPTFRLACERTLSPELARAGTQATVKGPVSYVDGWAGQALVVPPGSQVSFPTAGHLDPRAGTVALWTPTRGTGPRAAAATLFRVATADGELALRLPLASEPRFVAVVTRGAESLLPPPAGDGQWTTEAWQQLALTWDDQGCDFYVNGHCLAHGPAPHLPALAAQFALGCDVPVDDLTLYDRALTSFELYALARRRPKLALDAPNWLVNSSFECGPQPWQSASPGEWASRGAVDRRHWRNGRWSWCVDRSAAQAAAPSSAWLLGPWLHLPRGTLVTLSGWLKADRPGVEAHLQLQGGPAPRCLVGQARNGVCATQTCIVGTEWHRFVLTTTLPPAWRDAYRPRLAVVDHPAKVWVDDLQLAAGPERPYEPCSHVEIGLSMIGSEALGDPGRAVDPTLWVYAAPQGAAPQGAAPTPGVPERPVTVAFGYRRPLPRLGYQLASQVTVIPQTGLPGLYTLQHCRLADRGVWQVEAAHYGRSEARLNVAICPLAAADEPVPTSPLRIAGADPALAARFGLQALGPTAADARQLVPEGEFLASLGPGTSVIGFGAPSEPAPQIPWSVDAARRWDQLDQAGLLVRAAVLALWKGAPGVVWRTWDEEQVDRGPDGDGLLAADTYHTPKPALLAYAHLAHLLAGAQLPPERLPTADTRWDFRFRATLGTVRVVWDTRASERLDAGNGYVQDVCGNTLWRTALDIGEQPLYVITGG